MIANPELQEQSENNDSELELNDLQKKAEETYKLYFFQKLEQEAPEIYKKAKAIGGFVSIFSGENPLLESIYSQYGRPMLYKNWEAESEEGGFDITTAVAALSASTLDLDLGGLDTIAIQMQETASTIANNTEQELLDFRAANGLPTDGLDQSNDTEQTPEPENRSQAPEFQGTGLVFDEVLISGKRQISFQDVIDQADPYDERPGSDGKLVTRCSQTAQDNGLNIRDITLPGGDGSARKTMEATAGGDIDASVKQGESSGRYITSMENKTNPEYFNSAPEKGLFADVFVKSSSGYGHRAVAFPRFDVETKMVSWYLLDPYRNNKSTDAIAISDYNGDIMRVDFYESDVAVVRKELVS